MHDAWLVSGHCAHSLDCDRWRTGCGRCPDLTLPQPILRVGRTSTSGSQLNVNAANTISYGVYRVSVVATDSAGGRAQLQSQLTVPEGALGYQ